jgi:hypothetical protein
MVASNANLEDQVRRITLFPSTVPSLSDSSLRNMRTRLNLVLMFLDFASWPFLIGKPGAAYCDLCRTIHGDCDGDVIVPQSIPWASFDPKF